MRRFLLLSLLFVCAAAAEPEKEIDAIFAEWSGTRTPGCAVATMRDDRIVFERAYGMASLEHHVAITPRSVFGIQSTSKQFVAMAIILLIQDGRSRSPTTCASTYRSYPTTAPRSRSATCSNTPAVCATSPSSPRIRARTTPRS